MSYVYVISIDDLSLTKVGISDNPTSRLRQLSTGSPFKMRLALSIETPGRELAAALEQAFHRVQTDRRKNGEWFEMGADEACTLMAINFACCLKHQGNVDGDLIRKAFEVSGLGDYVSIFDLNLAGQPQ